MRITRRQLRKIITESITDMLAKGTGSEEIKDFSDLLSALTLHRRQELASISPVALAFVTYNNSSMLLGTYKRASRDGEDHEAGLSAVVDKARDLARTLPTHDYL
jgi:hypothetical protein